jgi:hypothetical protein
MENMANLGLFVVYKIVTKHRIYEKNLCLHGEDAKDSWRILVKRQETHQTEHILVNNSPT